MQKNRKALDLVAFDVHTDRLEELKSYLGNIPTVFQKRPNGLIAGISSCSGFGFSETVVGTHGSILVSFVKTSMEFKEISTLYAQMANLFNEQIFIYGGSHVKIPRRYKLYLSNKNSTITNHIGKVATSIGLDSFTNHHMEGIYIVFDNIEDLLKLKLLLHDVFKPINISIYLSNLPA